MNLKTGEDFDGYIKNIRTKYSLAEESENGTANKTENKTETSNKEVK
jgi:hypothetical protein